MLLQNWAGIGAIVAYSVAVLWFCYSIAPIAEGMRMKDGTFRGILLSYAYMCAYNTVY